MNIKPCVDLLQRLRVIPGLFQGEERTCVLELLRFLESASEPLDRTAERQRCLESAKQVDAYAAVENVAQTFELERAQSRCYGALQERVRLNARLAEQETAAREQLAARDARIRELSARVAERVTLIERLSWLRLEIMNLRDAAIAPNELDRLLQDKRGRSL